MKNLPATLDAFYRVHNPDKVAEVPRILERFKGKEERLVRELEKKYKVRLSDFEGIDASAIDSLSLKVGQSTQRSTPGQTPFDHDAIISGLRAELSKVKAAQDATLAEKIKLDAVLADMRHRGSTSEAQFREEKKTTDKLRELLKDAESRESATTQRLKTTEKQLAGLQDQLAFAKKDAMAARSDAKVRQQQAIASLRAQHDLQMQLDSVLSMLGGDLNPYEGTITSNKPKLPPDGTSQADARSDSKPALALAQAEISLLLRTKSDMEHRMHAKECAVQELIERTEGLRQQMQQEKHNADAFKTAAHEREKEVAALKVSLSEYKTQLSILDKLHEKSEFELQRAREVLKTELGTRRNAQVYFQQQLMAIEDAARARIAEALERSSLNEMDLLTQNFELQSMQKSFNDHDRGLLCLEIDELRRSLFTLANEKDCLEEDSKFLLAELRRASA